MKRVACLCRHVITTPSFGEELPLSVADLLSSSGETSGDDVVVCSALKKEVGKARLNTDLLAPLFKAVVDRAQVDPAEIGDCQIGSRSEGSAGGAGSLAPAFILQGSKAKSRSRAATTGTSSSSSSCTSGLQAVADVATSIRLGHFGVGIAAGIEPSTSSLNAALGVEPPRSHLPEPQLSLSDFAASFAAPSAAAKSQAGLQKQNLEFLSSKTTPTEPTAQVERGRGKRVAFEVSGDHKDCAEVQHSPAFRQTTPKTGVAVVLLARRSAAEVLGLPILATLQHFDVVSDEQKIEPNLVQHGDVRTLPLMPFENSNRDVFESDQVPVSQELVDRLNASMVPYEATSKVAARGRFGHLLEYAGQDPSSYLASESLIRAYL